MNSGASLNLGIIGNCTISALIDEHARLVWCCMPRFDADPIFHALLDSADGIGEDGSMQVVLESCVRTEQCYDENTAILRTRLFDGHGGSIEVTDFVPRFSHHDRPFRPMQLVRRVRPIQRAHARKEHTAHYWRQWVRRLALPLEWQPAVIRAAITLKLCLFEETGAIVAAMTTSIPEAPDSERNWDYRYCWLRDAFFVVRALNSLSEVSTMEDYLRWLRDAVGSTVGEHIPPLYGIGLERKLPERIVEHLGGYRGHRPVRVGNQAAEHFQHDVYGNIVLGTAQSFHDHRLLRRGNREEFALLELVGERAFAIHDRPAAGMWELRTRARVHTSSVLMNWAACDRLAKIAETFNLAERVTLWRDRAELIRAKILAQAWSEKRRAFVESFGGRELDASVLMMAEAGMIDPNDPRFVATVDALEAALCDGPYMRRYEAPDDFGLPETSFNICAFWRIDALARIGRKEQAREVFNALLAVRNPLGLLSEDTHPRTGELWGNFPQTYSMAGIINAATRLSAPWDSRI